MKTNLKRLLQKVSFGLASLVLTIFIFANAYEVIFNQDVPIAESVMLYAAQTPVSNLTTTLAIKQGANQNVPVSKLTNPTVLAIPDLNLKLHLEEARKINSSWYTRPGFGNYIILNTDSQNTPIDYLIYSTQSWNGIPWASQIEAGMDASIDHSDGAQLNFKVTAKELQDVSLPAVIATSETRQIILMVEDAEQNVYYYFTLTQEQ